jgi:superfamily II DNA or RNA helicase
MCEIWNFKVLNQAHTVKVKEPSLQPSPTTMARKKQKLIDEPKSCQDTLVPLTLFSSPPLLSVHQKQEPSIDTVVVLRPMQAQACEFISASTANVLLIMPTGSGKTRIIQQMMRDTHCYIVLSPYDLL